MDRALQPEESKRSLLNSLTNLPAKARLHRHRLHYNLGYILQQQSDLHRAAASYRQAILLARRSESDTKASSQIHEADAHHNLGVVLAKQEKWLAATYHYRRAIALKPRNIAAYCNLGTALLEQGEVEAAIDVYQLAVGLQEQAANAHSPIWAILYHNLAQALHKQRRLVKAVAAYHRSIEINPHKAQVHYNLGRALQQQANHRQAIESFQQAIQLDPELSMAQGDCAFSFLALGKFSEAMHCFRAAIAPYRPMIRAHCQWIRSREPGQDELMQARLACAQFLTALQKTAQTPEDSAAQEKKLQKSLVQTFVRWGNVMTTYGGSSQLRYAELLYQRALQIEPQRVELYLHLARCLVQQERYAAAIATYHLALTIAPDEPRLYTELATLLKQQQQWQLSLHYFREAIRLRRQKQRTHAHSPKPDELNKSVQASKPAIAKTGRRFPVPAQPAIKFAACSGPNAAPKDCEGLNCESCLDKINQWFEPEQLSGGVYRLSRVSDPLPAETDPRRSIASIPNGRAWIAPHRSGWQVCNAIGIYTATGELISQLSRTYPGQLPNCEHDEPQLQGIPAVQQLAEPHHLKGTAVVLSGLSGNIYFHWMTDVLPRLEILKQQGIDFTQIDWFIVNSQQRSFQQETLKAYGIPSDRIVESDVHSYLQADHLLVPGYPGALGWMQPWAIDALRQMFLPKVHSEFSQTCLSGAYTAIQHPPSDSSLKSSAESFSEVSSETPSHLYLSRADARYRQLLNEDEVLEYLKPFGFVSLTLDSLSVTEQARLFANAKVIIAPHGSSLTNLVFCQPGTKVIELVSPHYARPYFWSISRHLNLEHHLVHGRELSCYALRQLIYPNPLIEDIWIGIRRLAYVLQSIGLQQSDLAGKT